MPFEVLDSLATPETAAAARRLLGDDDRLRTAGEAAIRAIKERCPPSNDRGRTIKRIERAAPANRELAGVEAELAEYERTRVARDAALAALDAALAREEPASREAIRRNALAVLPDFAVIASQSLYEGLRGQRADEPGLSRSKARHWALYLQRVCAKNDAIGRFGPITWGHVDAEAPALVLEPNAGIDRRRVAPERWVARALVAAMKADAAVREEIAPLLHPDGQLEGATFVRLDRGEALVLDEAELALARRCDGSTPARELGQPDLLARLAERGIAIWEPRLAGADPDPVATLGRDVAGWSDGDAKRRWLPIFEQLAELVRRYDESQDHAVQFGVMEAVREIVTRVGGAVAETSRAQYRAINPIVEETYRVTRFVLGAGEVNAVLEEAAPWFDLNHDVMCFAASFAFARLREVYASAPRHGGRLSLPAFLAASQRAGIDLTRWGLPTLGQEAFRSLLPELAAAFGEPGTSEERTIGTAECHAVRRNHTFVRYPELSSPSIDIQIAARNVADVVAGRCDWIIAETHTYPFPLQWAGSWCCPDGDGLRGAVARVTRGRPVVMHTHAALEMPVHNPWYGRLTFVPGISYVASERPPLGIAAISPATTEVILDEEQQDIRLREVASGRDLGSLVRSDLLLNAVNPYTPFQGGAHFPRLRVGRAIVQRRTWVLQREELGLAPIPTGVSSALVLAIERLRARRGLPRWIYIKPADFLTSTDARGRDKDRKPIYIDLESYPFLDLVGQWFDKYEALEVTEMSPTPDRLCWLEGDGHRSFEIRALVQRS